MTTDQTVQNVDIRHTFSKPTAQGPPEITIVSHSAIVYWWPAWVVGCAVALVSYIQGHNIEVAPGIFDRIHASNNPGIVFIAVLVLLVVFTNSKLRGIYSVASVLASAFFVVLFAWLGWWDDILRFIPHLSARANVGFYLLFSTALIAVWLLAFFVFDRLIIWRVRPGQLLEERLVGGQVRSYDTNGLVFERHDQDLFHDIILGLGAGDLTLKFGGPNQQTIRIPNVLFVDRKVKAIERLIAVKPDQVRTS